MTTEYANDDFALGQLAAALGHAADAEALAARATGYRALFDPATGFLRGRWADGTFSDPRFDPTFFGPDFAEANAWQSLWMPAFDADGLASLMGGRAAMVAKLEELFTLAAQDAIDNPPGDITTSSSPRPYYWHANEPDLDAVYLFAQVGRPDLTARWLRWIQATHYAAAPDGLAGNDDGGTLSAWTVWSALGLYPLPGSDRYVIGAPLFPRADVAVEGGTFTIEAPAVSAENLYVQAVTLDGAPVAGPELRHGELRAGRTLRFEMGPAPGSWGR